MPGPTGRSGLTDLPRSEFGSGGFAVQGYDLEVGAALGNIPVGALTPDRIGIAYVNKTGVTVTVGQMLYVSGQDATTGLPSVTLAVNNVQGAFAKFVALAAVSNNATGIMGEAFTLTGQNTSAGNVGDPVWLSATPGGYTLTQPGSAATTFAQRVGRITVKSASVGQVRLDLFYNLSPVQIGANELVGNLLGERIQGSTGVIGTAAAAYVGSPVIIAKNGVIGGFRMSFLQSLATSDTNYISFAIQNQTQSLALLADTTGGRNTTKATGGFAIPQYTAIAAGFIISLTPSNLIVAAGDVITVQATVTGTLANTVQGTWSIGQSVT